MIGHQDHQLYRGPGHVMPGLGWGHAQLGCSQIGSKEIRKMAVGLTAETSNVEHKQNTQ